MTSSVGNLTAKHSLKISLELRLKTCIVDWGPQQIEKKKALQWMTQQES